MQDGRRWGGHLEVLAPYIFRVAISHRRILSADNGQVTFTNKDRSSGQRHRRTVPAHEFIRRFLQHVLPKGFVKVRHFGLFSPRHRYRLHQLRLLLGTHITPQAERQAEPISGFVLCCPTCGHAMRPVQRLRPRNRWPP